MTHLELIDRINTAIAAADMPDLLQTADDLKAPLTAPSLTDAERHAYLALIETIVENL